MTLAGFRTEVARDRDELRADLRARAERAELQADAYRDELAQLRAETSHQTSTIAGGSTPPRPRQAAQPLPTSRGPAAAMIQTGQRQARA